MSYGACVTESAFPMKEQMDGIDWNVVGLILSEHDSELFFPHICRLNTEK